MFVFLLNRMKIIFLRGLLFIYFPVMLGFVSGSQRDVVCADVVVVVTDSLQTRFVSHRDIRSSVITRFEGVLGESFGEMDFEQIEVFLMKHPAIKSCEVYNTLKGHLRIEIEQHLPLLRVFNGQKSYYLDEEGGEMPLFDSFTARVLVASGDIPQKTDSLVKLARFLKNDVFWEAQMEQIYIRRNGDYILVPRVGDHLILLGPPENIPEKLRNLRALYKNGLAPHEWNEYQIINLKYKGQVLCSKNRNL